MKGPSVTVNFPLERRRRVPLGCSAPAWLLHRSLVMLPIPGPSSMAHLEENVAAAAFELGEEQFEALAKVV